MESRTLDYFSSLNYICRRILQDQKRVEEGFGDRWDVLKWEEKEDAYNKVAVPPAVWERYQQNTAQPQPQSHPQSGGKVIIDYDNECQTWPDEHSGPFSWKTKSQQNLSLIDFEPDHLMKKPEKTRHPKNSNITSRENQDNKEFPWKPEKSIWDSPFLAGDRGMDTVFTNKKEDRQSSDSTKLATHQDCESLVVSDKDTFMSESSHEAIEPKNHETLGCSDKSSSLPRNSEMSNSFYASDGIDIGKHQGCIDIAAIQKNDVTYSQWSNFIGESSSDQASSATSTPTRRLLKNEPEPMIKISRGMDDDNAVLFTKSSEESASLLQNADSEKASLPVTEASANLEDNDWTLKRDSSSDFRKTGFDFLDDW